MRLGAVSRRPKANGKSDRSLARFECVGLRRVLYAVPAYLVPMIPAAISAYVNKPILIIVLAPVGLVVGRLVDLWAERGRKRRARAAAAGRALAREPVDALDPRLKELLMSSGSGASGSHSDVAADAVAALSGDLTHALEGAGRVDEHCILVEGNDAAQRTRTAFEALRITAGRRAADFEALKVLVPAPITDSVGPEALVRYLSLEPLSFESPVVLWLDEIDRWLAPGATLTVDQLERLAELDPPVAVLATIGPREKRRVLQRANSEAATAVLGAFSPDHTVFVGHR